MTDKHWTDVIIPFGKSFKGKTIEEVPSSYLRWLINNISEERYKTLVEAADKELSWREEWDEHI